MHILFIPISLKNLDPGLFCCFLKATYCTCEPLVCAIIHPVYITVAHKYKPAAAHTPHKPPTRNIITSCAAHTLQNTSCAAHIPPARHILPPVRHTHHKTPPARSTNILHAPPARHILHTPPARHILHTPPARHILHTPPARNKYKKSCYAEYIKPYCAEYTKPYDAVDIAAARQISMEFRFGHASCELRAASCDLRAWLLYRVPELRAASCDLRAATCALRTASCDLRDDELRDATCELRPAPCVPWVERPGYSDCLGI